jgi:hypothetical protein
MGVACIFMERSERSEAGSGWVHGKDPEDFVDDASGTAAEHARAAGDLWRAEAPDDRDFRVVVRGYTREADSRAIKPGSVGTV